MASRGFDFRDSDRCLGPMLQSYLRADIFSLLYWLAHDRYIQHPELAGRDMANAIIAAGSNGRVVEGGRMRDVPASAAFPAQRNKIFVPALKLNS